jgi:hypothetical protein
MLLYLGTDLLQVVCMRPLASAAVSGDGYSVGYSVVCECACCASSTVQSPYAAGMTDPNQATAATRVAIEFLMLWMEPSRPSAAEHIVRVLDDPSGPGRDQVIAGLLNLSMILAFELAKANGAADYPAWVGEWLRRHSPELPE